MCRLIISHRGRWTDTDMRAEPWLLGNARRRRCRHGWCSRWGTAFCAFLERKRKRAAPVLYGAFERTGAGTDRDARRSYQPAFFIPEEFYRHGICRVLFLCAAQRVNESRMAVNFFFTSKKSMRSSVFLPKTNSGRKTESHIFPWLLWDSNAGGCTPLNFLIVRRKKYS